MGQVNYNYLGTLSIINNIKILLLQISNIFILIGFSYKLLKKKINFASYNSGNLNVLSL